MRLAAAVLLALAAACGGTRIAPLDVAPGSGGPWDRLAPDELALLAEARGAFDAARLEAAIAALDALDAQRAARGEPTNLFAAALRQDVELEWLGAGRPLPVMQAALAASSLPSDGSPNARLRRWYRLRAFDGPPDVAEFVLAARMEDDESAALLLLDEAAAADDGCLWVHYGRAYVHLRQGDLGACRAALERAIELDRNHPRVRRLEATLLESLGEGEAARDLLARWTVEVAGDPRVSDGEVVDANLDLVHHDLVARRPEQALARLVALDPGDPQRQARTQLLLAEAWSALGRFEESLEASRLARTYQPSSFVAWVQEALVLGGGLGDLEGALEAWRAAAEVAAQQAGVDPAAAFTVQRARVEILRLERRIADAAGTGANGASNGAPRGAAIGEAGP